MNCGIKSCRRSKANQVHHGTPVMSQVHHMTSGLSPPVISQVLRPVEITMVICGLCPGRGGSRAARILTWTYSLCLLLAQVLNLVRGLSAIQVIGQRNLSNPTFTLYIVCNMWLVLCTANSAIYITCYARGMIGDLNTALEDCANKTCRMEIYKRRKTVKVVIAVFLMTAVVNEAILIFLSNTSSVFKITLTYPTNDWNLSLRLLVYLVHLYNTVVWLFAPAYLFLVIPMVTAMFKEHQARLQREISAGLKLETLEKSRQEFNDLSDLVGRLDALAGWLNGINFTVNLAGLLLLMYSEIFTDPAALGGMSEPVWVVIVVVWTVMSLAYLAVPTFLGASLNAQAHAVKYTLFRIELASDMAQTFKVQLSVYLTKLVSEKIGISVLQMFVLDKEAILAVVGFFLTYFILLVQFGAADANSGLDSSTLQPTTAF